MPLFEGHRDHGLQRLFIEMPDAAKSRVAWKWPDQQIYQHSQVNVDLDYQAVFTNLGQVIGVLGPGRHPLDEGAPVAYGWLVNHLTGDAYYDAEIYFVATRDIPGVEFGGPVDNVVDQPSGLVVSLRVFGELAYRVIDPAVLLGKFIGTGAAGDFDAQIATWVKDQALAAIRVVVPDVVGEHGVLAMGQIQSATADAALGQANEQLSPYGVALTRFAELNVNLPDGDAQQLKQFAATKAYSGLSGSFDSAVRGQAALEIAHGVSSGNVGAEPGILAGMMMGVPVAPAAGQPAPAAVPPAPSPAPAGGAPVPSPAPAPGPAPTAAPGPAPAAHFCTQCGGALAPSGRFCPSCGAPVQG
jgi:membrane protease subunit (stomatin/prohibitin family)